MPRCLARCWSRWRSIGLAIALERHRFPLQIMRNVFNKTFPDLCHTLYITMSNVLEIMQYTCIRRCLVCSSLILFYLFLDIFGSKPFAALIHYASPSRCRYTRRKRLSARESVTRTTLSLLFRRAATSFKRSPSPKRRRTISCCSSERLEM